MAAIANTGSIADFAYNRVDGVPAAISGTVMRQYAEANVYQLENWTGDSIGTTSIDQKYVPFLVEMTVAQTVARMNGIGMTNNWSLGDFSVNKGEGSSTAGLQVQTALDNAKLALKSLGRKNPIYATFYG